jgi:hypothetical protein
MSTLDTSLRSLMAMTADAENDLRRADHAAVHLQSRAHDVAAPALAQG